MPIAPAAHYLCGGVVTDLDGATDLPGLWAAGEVACSGVHGANRLASNSLLEGMVFGFRVVEAIEHGKAGPEPTGAMRAVLEGRPGLDAVAGRTVQASTPVVDGDVRPAAQDVRDRLQRLMTTGAGVVRSRESLASTRSMVVALRAEVGTGDGGLGPGSSGFESVEVRNLLVTAEAIVDAALAREESRGAHTRSDFPERDDQHFRVRLVLGSSKHQAGGR